MGEKMFINKYAKALNVDENRSWLYKMHNDTLVVTDEGILNQDDEEYEPILVAGFIHLDKGQAIRRIFGQLSYEDKYNGRTLHISELFAVDKKVEKAMLKSFENLALANKYKSISIDVRVQSLDDIKLFTSLGFQPARTKANGNTTLIKTQLEKHKQTGTYKELYFDVFAPHSKAPDGATEDSLEIEQ